MLKEKPLGPCPVCGESVWQNKEEDGPISVCPSDLDPRNPFYLAPTAGVSKKMMKDSGIHSECGEDFGLPCHRDLYMHPKCYENGGEY